MNTEDEHNYKGYPMEVTEVRDSRRLIKSWRVFSRNEFLSSGFTRDEAIKLAEQRIDKEHGHTR